MKSQVLNIRVGEAQGSKGLVASKGTAADTQARTTAPHRTVSSTVESSSGSSRPKKKRQEWGNCGKGKREGVKLQACAGCSAVLYCGLDCQRRNWPLHKHDCLSSRSKQDGESSAKA